MIWGGAVRLCNLYLWESGLGGSWSNELLEDCCTLYRTVMQ
jgi:hypothetical protein